MLGYHAGMRPSTPPAHVARSRQATDCVRGGGAGDAWFACDHKKIHCGLGGTSAVSQRGGQALSRLSQQVQQNTKQKAKTKRHQPVKARFWLCLEQFSVHKSRRPFKLCRPRSTAVWRCGGQRSGAGLGVETRGCTHGPPVNESTMCHSYPCTLRCPQRPDTHLRGVCGRAPDA